MNLVTAIDELKHTRKEHEAGGTCAASFRTSRSIDRSSSRISISPKLGTLATSLYNLRTLSAWCCVGGRPAQPDSRSREFICAVYTVDGLLSSDNYRKMANGHIRADYSEDFKPGSVLSIQTTEIHQVSNLQDSSELISLHFYLGPLDNSFLYSVQQPTHELYQRTYTRVFTLADGI